MASGGRSSSKRRRRARAMLSAALLVGVTAIGGTQARAGSRAGAAARLEVDAGYDGNFVPGRLVPVRVRITADQLIEGVLQVRVDVPGSDSVPVSVPVEVPGGTDKEFLVSLPTVAARGQVDVTAVLAGTGLSGEGTLAFTGDTELVGLLPGVGGRLPGPLTLPAGLGTARFSELGEAELTTPGALDPLGTIVAGPEGLADLDDDARRNLVGWLGAGGHLVVDAVPGEATDTLAGLPDVWQPPGATRYPAGRGEVRFSSGAAADGRWDEVVEPTSLLLPGEVSPSGMNFAPEGLADAVARDGGLRVPTIGWLAGFLVAYVLLAGPVLFLVLRAWRRSGWAWVAIPVVAAVFATGAFVVGHGMRSSSVASHGSIVHTTPAGTEVLSYVGLVSRSGADGRAEFPAGWSASGAGTMFGELGGIRGGAILDGDGDGTGVGELGPARVSLAPGATIGEVDLDPGGFGLISGWGAADEVAGLVVHAEAQPDGSVTGTLRNDSGMTLRHPVVTVGERSWGSDDPLPAGEEITWEIAPATGVPDPLNGSVEISWAEQIDRPGVVLEDSPVNLSLWAELVGQITDPYPTGLVLAAAWTREWVPPVDAGHGDIGAGRTAFVVEAQVTAPEGAAPAAAVGREYLRRSPVPDDPRFDAIAERLGNEGFTLSSDLIRYRLPPTSSGGDSGLLAKLPGSAYDVDAWVDGGWVPLERRSWGGEVVDEDAAADVPPWEHQPSVARVPPEAVADGVVYLRVVGSDLAGPFPPRVTLEQAG